MPKIAFPRFRAEVLELYRPPLRARNTWFKVRQVLDLTGALSGVKTTADLTPATVARFIRIDPGWAPATVKGLLSYLSPLCRYAAKMGYVRISPFEVRPIKEWLLACEPREDARPSHLTMGEVASVLRVAESRSGTWRGARSHALVATAAYTGMRRTELLTRAVEDFDLATRVCRVRPRKGRRLKTAASAAPVPIPEALLSVLERWLPRTGSEWAFPGVRGKTPWTGGPVGGRAIDDLKSIGAEAGVPHVTWQLFRHTYATMAEVWGLPEMVLQRVLRHTTLRTSREHYRHADERNLAEAVKDISFAPRARTGT